MQCETIIPPSAISSQNASALSFNNERKTAAFVVLLVSLSPPVHFEGSNIATFLWTGDI